MGAPAGFELLEHTADVGIRAWGSSANEAFAEAALGLAGLMGIRVARRGERRTVRARAGDLPALLVAFLDELLGIYETESLGFAAVDVIALSEHGLIAEVETGPAPVDPVGTSVKAATYHQLAVEHRPGGAVEVRVFLDV